MWPIDQLYIELGLEVLKISQPLSKSINCDKKMLDAKSSKSYVDLSNASLFLSMVDQLAQGFAHLLTSYIRTGKSLSEALIFPSTNPQYDDRLLIELQVQYKKFPSSNLGRTCCVQKLFLTFRTIFVHNMFSPCSEKRRASYKDLLVLGKIT